MTGAMDFSLSHSLASALVLGLLQPAFLLATTRLPALSGKNASQFLAAIAASYGFWVLLILSAPDFRPDSLAEFVVGTMAIAGAALVYLEIWGLLSRGYTLGVLLTLHRAGRSMSPPEIAASYRGGDGLDWIVHHRIGGLESSGMVRRSGNRLALSSFPGAFIGRLHRLAITILGLRHTG